MANGNANKLVRQGVQAKIIDQVLKPALRAYAFGHISTTGPKIAGLLLALISRKKSIQRHIEKLKYISSASVGLFRFPAFCAALVGLYSTLSLAFITSLQRWAKPGPALVTPVSNNQVRVARLVAALIASWVTFPMLNRGDARKIRRRARSDVQVDPTMAHLMADPIFAAKHGGIAVPIDEDAVQAAYAPGGRPPPALAGRTLDLTIMAVVRAVETLIWHGWRRRYHAPASSVVAPVRPGFLARSLAGSSDSALFITACFVIMWSWFYAPGSLPASYRRWIGQAAGVDPRLVEILRKARWGSFVYGSDTGQAYVLESMCRDLHMPEVLGDPAVTVPVPCALVHQGTGPDCHWHTATKFARSFRFAMRMYLPLQLVLRLRGARSGEKVLQALKKSVVEAGRSSAFLGAFVSLFYYGVCSARTLYGPRIWGSDVKARQWFDSGACVAAGSALCGWSVLLEPARRRKELALFVAPRAASCFVPPRYDRKYLDRERAAFASGVAVLFALAHENPANVRGILGTLINTVIG